MMKKRVVVSDESVKAAGRRATKASAALEGQEVPEGFQRSPAAEAYLQRLAQNDGGAQHPERIEGDG